MSLDYSDVEANINAYTRLNEAFFELPGRPRYLDVDMHVPTIDGNLYVGINNMNRQSNVSMAEARFSATRFDDNFDVCVSKFYMPDLKRITGLRLVRKTGIEASVYISRLAFEGYRLSINSLGNGELFGINDNDEVPIVNTDIDSEAIRAFSVGCHRALRVLGQRATKLS